MNKFLKWSFGLFAAAGVAHVAYHGSHALMEIRQKERMKVIREHFSDEKIATVWLSVKSDENGEFDGGILLQSDQYIQLKIHGKSLEIKELERGNL